MQKLSTTEIWTSGIVNVPLDPKLRDSRYTFFELDTKEINKVREVLEVYYIYLDSVYIHELINGFHFFNVDPIHKDLYGRILRKIKHLNPDCPMTTLRIIPNKWKNEMMYWRKASINGIDTGGKLADLRHWIEGEYTHMIASRYQVVRYPFEECQMCKSSKSVYWNQESKSFMCKDCHVQTRGRLNK